MPCTTGRFACDPWSITTTSACMPEGNLPGTRPPAHSSSRLLCPDRLDIGDDLEEIRLVDLVLEGRHHRLVPGHDLVLWPQDRVADVALIGQGETDVAALLDPDGPPIDPLQQRGT